MHMLFGPAGQQLLEHQQDAAMKETLTAVLTNLMSHNGIAHDLSRPNMQRFRQNLAKFVVDARSIVRIK